MEKSPVMSINELCYISGIILDKDSKDKQAERFPEKFPDYKKQLNRPPSAPDGKKTDDETNFAGAIEGFSFLFMDKSIDLCLTSPTEYKDTESLKKKLARGYSSLSYIVKYNQSLISEITKNMSTDIHKVYKASKYSLDDQMYILDKLLENDKIFKSDSWTFAVKLSEKENLIFKLALDLIQYYDKNRISVDSNKILTYLTRFFGVLEVKFVPKEEELI